ncbi:hypothetical protein C9374_008327 [Naegleria lovaniensis]|uniref:Uncharacterized protein n=1 Tax=Naegleria lovaniensis TaxID=51637 RepID=A0AA88GIN1_NAELO|nr:uncharacterized protein C9374_008327 [Naegleria lovaniensis]KAG2378184.1 hypothetical protein C9374_008327 [Naegleria lovaniensis]
MAPTPSSASSSTSSPSLWESILNALKQHKGLAAVLGTTAASVVGFVLYSVFSKNKSTKKLAVSIKNTTTEKKPTKEVATSEPVEPEFILYDEADSVPSTQSWKSYSHKKIGISFKMPTRYEVEVHSQGPITTITLVDTSNMNMMMMGGDPNATMITIEDVPPELDIKQYLKNNVSALAQTQVPFKVEEEKDNVKVNGIPACQMISELSGQQKVKIFAVAFKNPLDSSKVFMVQHICTDLKTFSTKIEQTKNLIRTITLQKAELFGKVSYRNDKLGYILHLPSTSFLATGNANDRALYLSGKDVQTYLFNYSKDELIDREIVIISNGSVDFEQFVQEQKQSHSSKEKYHNVGHMKIGTCNGEIITYSAKCNSYVASEKEKADIQHVYDFIEVYFQRGSTVYTILGRSLPQVSEKFNVEFVTMIKKMKLFDEVDPAGTEHLIYENSEFNFKISQPVSLQSIVKENSSDNPVVTLLTQGDESSLPLETLVTIAEPNQMMPVSDLDSLVQLVKAELQMVQLYSGGAPVEIKRDEIIKLKDGSDAFSMVYVMVDGMTGENLVMHQTGLLLPSKKIASIKSYTYQPMYNENVKHLFDEIHSSFRSK